MDSIPEVSLTQMKVIKTEPKAKATKTDAAAIPHYMSRKDAKCPKVGEGPVDYYKGGRIYTSVARTAFRVIRKRGVFNTDESMPLLLMHGRHGRDGRLLPLRRDRGANPVQVIQEFKLAKSWC